MAIQDAPDGTVWTQVIEVVSDTPVPPSPAHEKAITKLARLTPGTTEYDTVVEWEVDEDTIGVLHAIELMSDEYAKTRFQLTIAGVQQFTGIELAVSLTLSYPDVKLAAGDVVLLEAKSIDETAINVDGDITGKELV